VLAPALERNRELQPHAGLALEECLRLGAGTASTEVSLRCNDMVRNVLRMLSAERRLLCTGAVVLAILQATAGALGVWRSDLLLYVYVAIVAPFLPAGGVMVWYAARGPGLPLRHSLAESIQIGASQDTYVARCIRRSWTVWFLLCVNTVFGMIVAGGLAVAARALGLGAVGQGN
jgi:hypothetical protein